MINIKNFKLKILTIFREEEIEPLYEDETLPTSRRHFNRRENKNGKDSSNKRWVERLAIILRNILLKPLGGV